MSVPRIRPARVALDELRRSFRRGREEPRGVVWYGARSFWGHLRHLIASGIATEDVDSRDWMSPDEPQALVDRLSTHLGAENIGGSLSENLGRDVWIDYVADTGDDCEVSRAVGRLLFSDYELPDPGDSENVIVAPRGDILFFGGDTAYPVATVEEINNRVVVPFNLALAGAHDDKPRALLGIPGNHDWYDGLDGFARMFRRRVGDHQQFRPSMLPVHRNHYADWAKEFVLGGQIEKIKTLDLDGYTPMQRASFFALPLTPDVHLLAADRQLKYLDFRQKRFFLDWRSKHPDVSWVVMLPNPVFAFSRLGRIGASLVRALELDLEHERHLILSGDVHHYERKQRGESLHVVAGGGGAFLHPAPLGSPALGRPDVEWPGPGQCRALLWRVPWKVASGRSGFLPHWFAALLFLPMVQLGAPGASPTATALAGAFVFAITALIYAAIGGYREAWKRKRVVLLSLLGAAFMAAAPLTLMSAVNRIAESAGGSFPGVLVAAASLLSACCFGALLFGIQLALFTAFGLEHTQAFTALDHPGFKHFLRLRVRADGKTIDAWCIGKVDPLRPGEEPVLVDQFTWRAR